MTPQQIIEICQAIIDGKPAQFKTHKDDQWWNYDPRLHALGFGRTMEWRIKPQPREWWLNATPSGLLEAWNSKESAYFNGTKEIQPIHVREVIDE